MSDTLSGLRTFGSGWTSCQRRKGEGSWRQFRQQNTIRASVTLALVGSSPGRNHVPQSPREHSEYMYGGKYSDHCSQLQKKTSRDRRISGISSHTNQACHQLRSTIQFGTASRGSMGQQRRLQCFAAKKEKKAKGPGKKGTKKTDTEETEAAPAPPPYGQGEVILNSLAIIDSFFRATGTPLFAEPVEIQSAARALWEAPFLLLAHGTEEDPIFFYGRGLEFRRGLGRYKRDSILNVTAKTTETSNFSSEDGVEGNSTAMTLFETEWEAFTSMPSRLTASEEERLGRESQLTSAKEVPINIGGAVRVSTNGRMFQFKDGILWTLKDLSGKKFGQAAVVGSWEFEDEKDDSLESKDEVVESTDAEAADSTPARRFELSTTPVEIVASETLD